MPSPEWSAILWPFLIAFAVTVGVLFGLVSWIRMRLARSAAQELDRLLAEFRCETQALVDIASSVRNSTPTLAEQEVVAVSSNGDGVTSAGVTTASRGISGSEAIPRPTISDPVRARSGNTESASSPPPTLITVPCVEARSEEDRASAAESLGRRHAAVWELARGGHSIEEITKATGQPIGEIEVILNLQRQIQSHESTT